MKELTLRALILGAIIGIIFGAANAYLALKVGMTVSASIPAAVISMAVLRGIMRKGTILENNIVQTIGSSGEGLAAGVVFTIPAFFLLQISPSAFQIMIISILGGILGILFMIPLRRHLIVEEHEKLPYPEGTACAEVLLAGDKGGSMAKTVFLGTAVAGIYKILMSGFKMWKDTLTGTISAIKGSSIGIELTPALLGVGFIIGPQISALVFAGGVLGSFVLSPLIAFVGEALGSPLAPSTKLISELSAGEIRSNYVRYIGAGAVAFGGAVSLFKTLPTIFSSFKIGIAEIFKGRVQKQVEEKDRDLPMSLVLITSIVIVLVIWFLPFFRVHLAGAIIIVIAGFLFVAVASRIVGLIGSSSSPVSGMTIATLILTSLVFLKVGLTGTEGMVAALSVGAVVCIAICMAGDASQDLKTGYLVGSKPYLQQIAEFIGVIIPAFIMGGVLLLLHRTYVIGSEELSAPQASLMSMVVKGIMTGTLPWTLVIIGVFMSAVIELLGVSSLPFAIGLYLPLSLSTPIMIGGIIAWFLKRYKQKDYKEYEHRGVLYCSGLIAGDALSGIAIALLCCLPGLKEWYSGIKEAWFFGKFANIGSLIMFCILIISLWKVITNKTNEK